MIEVRNIAGKGRGIVATQALLTGAIIEVAPVSILEAEERDIVRRTSFFKYSFVQPVEYSQDKYVKGYIVFGLASLCNHDENPNSRIDWVENEIGIWSHLIAQREIHPGEEITLRYTNLDEYSDISFGKSYQNTNCP